MTGLLEFAIAAHGGLARWREVQAIDFLLSIDGELWRSDEYPKGLDGVGIHMETAQPFVMITPFGGISPSGYFRPDLVRIRGLSGKIIAERSSPSERFEARERVDRWDTLDTLFLVGWTVWLCLSVPFLLTRPGFNAQEIEPHFEQGEKWRRLRVDYPFPFPSRCTQQTFYFDKNGLLRRIDYRDQFLKRDVAHYCFDHVVAGGLSFPTRRRIVEHIEDGPKASEPAALLLQLSDITTNNRSDSTEAR